MKNCIVILFLLTAIIPANSKADWNKWDTLLELTYTTAIILDWGQTAHIAKNPIDHGEMNPILGAQPTLKSVNIYFPSMIVIHAAVSYFLPGDLRRVWQCITIGVQSGSVYRNFSRGVYLDFGFRLSY